jgi:hypothetical protein
MNGGLTDAEFVGDLVLRSTAPDGGDDGSTASGFALTLLMTTSGEGMRFSVQITPD